MKKIVSYKDQDGSIKMIYGEIIEEREKGIVVQDDEGNQTLIYKINIL
jgi:hypothetical protein